MTRTHSVPGGATRVAAALLALGLLMAGSMLPAAHAVDVGDTGEEAEAEVDDLDADTTEVAGTTEDADTADTSDEAETSGIVEDAVDTVKDSADEVVAEPAPDPEPAPEPEPVPAPEPEPAPEREAVSEPVEQVDDTAESVPERTSDTAAKAVSEAKSAVPSEPSEPSPEPTPEPSPAEPAEPTESPDSTDSTDASAPEADSSKPDSDEASQDAAPRPDEGPWPKKNIEAAADNVREIGAEPSAAELAALKSTTGDQAAGSGAGSSPPSPVAAGAGQGTTADPAPEAAAREQGLAEALTSAIGDAVAARDLPGIPSGAAVPRSLSLMALALLTAMVGAHLHLASVNWPAVGSAFQLAPGTRR